MKKIIKKLGVIGLALAVLIPFMDLPKVKAANDDCQYHLQNYLFLDVNGFAYANVFEGSTGGNYSDGYQTTTSFPFEFDNSAEITNISYSELKRDSDISTYVNMHNMAIARNNADNNLKDELHYYKGIDKYGASFASNTSSDYYSTNTILLHGDWGQVSSDFESIKSTWDYIDSDQTLPFSKYVLQNTPVKSGMNVTINYGKWNGSKAVPTTTALNNSSMSTLQQYVDDPESAENSKLLGITKNNGSEMYTLPISITRQITDDSFKNAKFGYSYNNALYVFGSLDSGAAKTVDNAKNSYENYKQWIADNNNGSRNEDCVTANKCYKVDLSSELTTTDFNKDPKETAGIDFNIGGAYYWPFILNVEYKTCGNAGDPTEGNWNLKYDANADGNPVNNIPDEVTNIALNATVDVAEGPTRDGWTFKQWCTNPNGSGQCVNAGGKITSDKSKTVILYAQWGQTGTTTNGKTGIVSYIISFVAVGAIAGGIYYVSKKKNLFKQI